MLGSFTRVACASVAGALIATSFVAPSVAMTTPPGDHVRAARFALSTGIVQAEMDGPRCRNRRAICRRYSSDARTIRCLERFGCFTGPSFFTDAD